MGRGRFDIQGHANSGSIDVISGYSETVMAAENGGDRREIDKLRAQLETERFDSLKKLLDTRFDRVDDKLEIQGKSFEKLEKRLDEHIGTPHNLAAVAAAAAAVPPLPNPSDRDEEGFWRTVKKYWKIAALLAGFGTVGGGGYVFRGCGALAGTEIHLHNMAEMTASAVSNSVPTPTKGPN